MYTVEYIRRALSGAPLTAPDRAQSEGYYDALLSLYSAAAAGGVVAVRMAWDTVRALRPYLKTLMDEHEQRLIIHADELKNLKQPVALLPDYPLYDDGFNVLVGPSGCGKSFVALDIAGRISVKDAVVYIAGEGLSGFAARWEAYKDFYQITKSELYFYTAALQIMDASEMQRFIELINRHKPRLVIIDTFARSAVGVDENSALDMGRFVDACDQLRRTLRTSILVVHHTGKNGVMRGSSALYAAADSVLAMAVSDERRTVYNDPEYGGKNKHAAAAPARSYFLKPHEANGFQGAVLIEAENLSADDRRISDKQKSILLSLEGYESGMTAQQVIDATELKSSTVYHNLKQLMKMGYLSFADNHYTLTSHGESAIAY